MAIILYAEDEEDDVFFLRHAFQIAGLPHTLNVVADGEQAIAYLAGEELFEDRSRFPLPALILLDVNMPRKSGFEVLQWIRQEPDFKSLPVIILTSSSRPEDMQQAGSLGADEYLLKPSDPLKLAELVKAIDARWLAPAQAVG